MHYNDFLLFGSDQKTMAEKVSYFQRWCRLNYNEFYSLFNLLKSLAAFEKEKHKLNDKLKIILTTWNTKV